MVSQSLSVAPLNTSAPQPLPCPLHRSLSKKELGKRKPRSQAKGLRKKLGVGRSDRSFRA